ncbi:MAG: alkanesulfonate monooxygenase SsuD [Alphaproteobacteria bacterium]|jgi:alkanesulfonate monooxygenase SsuD/methylene tetrahydromethanopterin reductase-like flavin-dependent oxidoreductase (luciferase family)
MKFGYFVSPQFSPDQDIGQAIANMSAQVRAARAAGFESIWVPQHFLTHPMRMFQPHELLARLSAEAEGMRLGTGILLLSMQNSVAIAEQAVTLDWMSEGGYVLAAGMGYRQAEFQGLGVPMKERVGRLVEGVELIRRLWTEERVTHHGKYFHVEDCGLSLRPRNPQGCGLWVGGAVEPAIQRAAKIADSWLGSFTSGLPALRGMYATYRNALATNAIEEGETPLCRECFVGPSDALAAATARGPIVGKYAASDSWDNKLSGGLNETFEAERDDKFLIGDAAHVRDLVAQYRDELGVSTLMLRMSWPGLDHAQTCDSIERFGDIIRDFS